MGHEPTDEDWGTVSRQEPRPVPREPGILPSPSPADLRARLAGLTVHDRLRLERRLGRSRGGPAPSPRLLAEVALAEERVARRRAAVPVVSYPADLPITARVDDIADALRDHQVVVVAGETGSGKSTQLPKICLQLGRGVHGMIGHTQPRRVAARSVAERVAEELGSEVGAAVGYTVRFTDRVGDTTLVRVMTDGILLAEIQRDRLLSRYDTIIVDEAHERSLNVDFLLGYLTQLLPSRPDLKVVITSATIDTARFADHFGGAPVVEVSGRSFPVDVRYRPFGDAADDDRDQTQAVCDAVDELCTEGPGDILVFLSGEREIHDAADALRRLERRGVELLPLYARLSAAEQHRIFQSHPGRRVVLATNVAETSITVPGVRFVVDAGTARISRYSHRLKVQRLPIEAISQASARQRAGRCGRVAPGTCIRLYPEDDFDARPEFTEPEILRTNLAAVILQMTALGLGDVAAFPFVEPPDARAVADGVAVLEELGALDRRERGERRRLTPLGRRLAQLPVDPRLGRMVIEAESLGCAREVMVIAAALSIQDPRERPKDALQAANELHARFADESSDFLGLVNLWDHLRTRQRELSSTQFRKLCRAEHLSYLRVREWQDLYSQLRQVAGGLGIRTAGAAAHPDHVHRALLSGLLSQIGMRDPVGREFTGARNAHFTIGSGSVLAKKPPKWVMAAELVETNRLWARVTARIQPEWAERLADHLVVRTYSEPHWDAGRGAVMAFERVTLYGLPLVTARPVQYGRVDPEVARELFIRHALVEGDWSTDHAFVAENERRVAEVVALEDRVRRRDLLVDDDTIFDFFDARVGADVTSVRHFDQWWKQTRTRTPELLVFPPGFLVDPKAGVADLADLPTEWHQGDLTFRLSYRYTPGSPLDGVTVHIPLAVLHQVDPGGFDWFVPAWRDDLVTALLRSLPKPIRRHVVPVPDHVDAFLDVTTSAAGPLVEVLSQFLARRTGEAVPAEAFTLDRVPEHLRFTYLVEDADGRPLAYGKTLRALQHRLRAKARRAVADAAAIEQNGLVAWSFGDLPREVEVQQGGHVVRGYPTLVDEGDSVAVRIVTTPAEQARLLPFGLRRLLLLTLPSPQRALRRLVGNDLELALARTAYGSVAELLDDCTVATVDVLIGRHGEAVWDEAAFAALSGSVRDDLVEVGMAVVRNAERVIAAAAAVEARLDRLTGPAVAPAVLDARSEAYALVRPGFVTAAGAQRLADLVRYLTAIERRLDKLPGDLARDTERMRRVQAVERAFDDAVGALPRGQRTDEVERVRWMLEELRVSTFAQTLGTNGPVSEQRVRKALANLARPT
jgi:ATP-dependent helicase HrpA